MHLSRLDKIVAIIAGLAFIAFSTSIGMVFYPGSIIDFNFSTDSFLNEPIAITSLIVLILVAIYTFLKIVIKIKDNFGNVNEKN